ncbi:SPASM domain-containing protein [bacterium]|nr:SPASM domain-containing protein [candidate division CSSED10-310 bacterium]
MTVYLEEHPSYIAFMTGADGTLPLPRTAGLELSSAGHSGCPLCEPFRTPRGKRVPEVIGKPLLDRVILDVLPYVDTLRICGDKACLGGDGPLPYLLAHAARLQTAVILCTDADGVHDAAMEAMARYGLKALYLLLDVEPFGRLTREDNTPAYQLMSNLHKLEHMQKTYGTAPVAVYMIGVVNDRTIQTVPAAIDWCNNAGIKGLFVNRPSQAAGQTNTDRHVQAAIALAHRKAQDTDTTFLVLKTGGKEQAPEDVAACRDPFMHLTIEANGEVRICKGDGPVVGNLFWQPLRDIWHGRMAQDLRRGLLSGESTHTCRDCMKHHANGPPPRTTAQPILNSIPHPQLAAGFMAPDAHNALLTGWSATFFLDGGAGESVLVDLGAADDPIAGTLLVDGRTQLAFSIEAGERRTIGMDIDPTRRDLIRADLRVAPQDRREPPDHSAGEPRESGFRFWGTRMVEWRKKATFGDAITFLDGELIGSRLVIGGQRYFRSYWRWSAATAADLVLVLRFAHEKIHQDLNSILRRFMVRHKDRLFAVECPLPGVDSTAGELLVLETPVTAPDGLVPGGYCLELAVGAGHGETQLLEPTTDDWQINGRRMLLGVIEVAPPTTGVHSSER